MEQKYRNFQAFIGSQIPHSPINFVLQGLNAVQFKGLVDKMKAAVGPNISPEDAAQQLLDRLKLNSDDFDIVALDKFARYVEYFMQC